LGSKVKQTRYWAVYHDGDNVWKHVRVAYLGTRKGLPLVIFPGMTRAHVMSPEFFFADEALAIADAERRNA
jgi:hypothetical protein